MIRRAAAAAALALTLAASSVAPAEDAVPTYALPEGLAAATLDPKLDEAARAAVATILDPPTCQDAEDALRTLAGLGRGALPHVVRGLAGANWYARSILVAAVAEMDGPDATPLLVAACRDPAFAVREAAVVGLGKTGDARGAAALIERAAMEKEPVWRVRAAAAPALRRGVLRRVVDRPAGETALARLLADADDDVRRAALKEAAPLAADAALPTILDLFADPATPSADRTLALAALRAYRSPKPELLAALRRGLLSGEDPGEACEAGRALLAMSGVSVLDDEEVSAAVVHRMNESNHDAIRDGLARLKKPVAPWLRARVLALASRIAAARDVYDDTPIEELIDTLIQVDETAGIELLKEFLFGPDAGTFDDPTRRAALRKVEIAFAPRLSKELRALFDKRAGISKLAPDVLRAIAASGGDDLAERFDAALAPDGDVRAAAFELLDSRPDLPAGPRLLALAADAAEAKVRRAALETLSRRDPARAAALAASLLDDPRAEMRSKAVLLLSASREPKDFDRLVARLAVEDGADARPSKTPTEEPAPTAVDAPVTPSETSGAARRRSTLVHELVDAVAKTGGTRARPVLLHVVESDADAFVRETAAQRLRGIAEAEDAARLLAAEAKENDQRTRIELRRTLATLGGAPDVVRFFEREIADQRTRPEALRLLAEDASRVVTDGLAAGAAGRDWTDDERRRALVALIRVGRGPDAAGLAAIALDARTLELCGDAARMLSALKTPDAARELLALVGKIRDTERLAVVVQALGDLGAPEAEAPLLDLFEKSRDRAFAAASSADPAVDLYRRCADAVAEFGSERTGRALAEHLLDPRLAHAAGRCAVTTRGPFQPAESAPIALLKSLVAAFARRDDAACGKLLGARIDALAADGRDVAMPEGFAAGLARYFEDPCAYGLPARPRPSAALPLWEIVINTAPRLSELDVMACQAIDDILGEKRRWREAGDALRGYVALADVEDAGRAPETRLAEAARIAVRDALALAAVGRADDALAAARAVRAADPSNAELAYRAAWCLIRLGRADAEAKDHLLFAAAQDDKDARIHFYLGWIADRTGDGRAALKAYRQAVELDHKRVQSRAGDETFGYRGAPHDVAAYAYWHARALRAAGLDDDAAADLATAVSLDDRTAAEARADPVFAGWDRLEPAVRAGLARIRVGALR